MTVHVKVYSSEMSNAPVLSGTPGALLAVLKACLVDGFGLKSCDGITVAAGVATATFSTGHSFIPGYPALIAGATPAGLNGEFRVLTTATNSITFAAPGVADGAATGTITAKVAPAQWIQAHSATNIGVFKSASLEATGLFLRVDDTGTTTCRVVGYESMTDANTGVNAFPTTAQFAGGYHWHKSSDASTYEHPWFVIADDKTLLLWVSVGNDPSYRQQGIIYGFGDFNSCKEADPWGCMLSGSGASSPSSESLGYGGGAEGPNGLVVARSHSGIGAAVPASRVGALNITGAYSGRDYSGGLALIGPNPADNSLRLTPVELVHGGSLRGPLRGLYHTPQAMAVGTFPIGSFVDGAGVYAGRKMLALGVGRVSDPLNSVGTAFIDATGPW